ncbi:MAG: phytanoyl-CoA dioxygenase family protein [Pseudomonadales bacterium]
MHALSPAERGRYDADGFLVRRGVLRAAEVAALRDAAERTALAAAALAARGRSYHLDGNRFADADGVTVQFEHGAGSGTVRVVEPAHVFDPRWDALLDDDRLVAPMRALVGCDRVALWTDKLNLKRPREGSGFRWHQDSPYWIHDCGHVDRLPNVMVILDDATAANGCLRIIRGSHRQGRLPGTDDGTQLGGFFTDPGSFDEADQVPIEAPAGSLVFFSPHAVHGSLPNRSAAPRRAWIATYQPGDQRTLKLPCTRNCPNA